MRFDKRFTLRLSAALLCLAPVLYGAPVHGAASDGYLTDSAGKPVRSYSGECVRTYAWREGFRFADRIGPAAYNQRLSERRANAMREYLIAQGIDTDKISASGVGESEPVTSCSGERGRRLIACLQPDRSAQLTAVGSELRVSDASR
jgi:hypothetical protein